MSLAPLADAYLLASMAAVLGILTSFGAYHLTIGLAGLRHRKRAPAPDLDEVPVDAVPPITFLVTAYGEGETVVECVDAILASDYPKDRLRVVLVVDADGEGTVDAVRAHLADATTRVSRNEEGDEILHAGRVTAILQLGDRAGRGKPRALQNGLRYTPRHGLVGILDADHLLEPDFAGRGIAHFRDPQVGIVQGRRMPKRPPATWVARWDVLEQNVGQVQTLMSRDRVGCASFYGSTALIRADLLHTIGWENCLSEDTLMHYEVRERGYRVAYEPETGSREEHVSRVRHYIPQRRRWSAGHMQVMFGKLGRLVASPLPTIQRLDAAFHLTYYHMTLFLLLYWLLRATYYWVQQTGSMLLAAVAGASLLVGSSAFAYETRTGGRGQNRWNGLMAASVLAFCVLSLAAAYAVPPAEPAPFPVGLEVALFIAPLLQMGLGYLNPRLRPAAAGPLDHARNVLVLVIASPFMLLVSLYATLTGIIVSIRGPQAAWVKTVRSKETGRRNRRWQTSS